jgi:acyl transferase domain-containing protein
VGGGTRRAGATLSKAAIASLVASTVSSVLGLDINPDEPLLSSGLDSLGAVELRNSLAAQMPSGLDLPATLLFDFPSINALTGYISSQIAVPEEQEAAAQAAVAASPASLAAASDSAAQSSRIISIAAFACRSPGQAISSLAAVDAITAVPLQRWDWEQLATGAAYQQQQLQARFGGWLADIEQFDAAAFGISGVEAVLMDVQQRLLLQLSLEALSSAAAAETVAPGSMLSAVSGAAVNACVAVGIASAEYNNWLLARTGAASSAYSATGGALSVACGRIAFTYGMRGAALSVDTACSSSLVATHFVGGQMRSGLSAAGLAAGVGLLLSPNPTSMFQKAGMLAPDGRCKTLDAAADGYVRAEAAGVLLLQAHAAGASAAAVGSSLAVLAGSAVNQDGRSSSLTAPNGPAQQDVLRAALADGGLLPGDISGLQMHGTGTPLGDPIEVGAVAEVLQAATPRQQPLVASAGKSWIGHTEAAAGVMGLTHALVGLGGNAAQPLLHLSTVNPYLEGALSGPAGAWSLPRQAGGLPCAATAALLATGVSSFAFQVGVHHPHVRGLLERLRLCFGLQTDGLCQLTATAASCLHGRCHTLNRAQTRTSS